MMKTMMSRLLTSQKKNIHVVEAKKAAKIY